MLRSHAIEEDFRSIRINIFLNPFGACPQSSLKCYMPINFIINIVGALPFSSITSVKLTDENYSYLKERDGELETRLNLVLTILSWWDTSSTIYRYKNEIVYLLPIITSALWNWFSHDYGVPFPVPWHWRVWIGLNQKWSPVKFNGCIAFLKKDN